MLGCAENAAVLRLGSKEKPEQGSGVGGMNNSCDVTFSCLTASPVIYSCQFMQQESPDLLSVRTQEWLDNFHYRRKAVSMSRKFFIEFLNCETDQVKQHH